MAKKYYTLDQAHQILPSVKQSLLKMLKLQNSIELIKSVQVSHKDPFEDAHRKTHSFYEYHNLSRQYYANIHDLFKKGIFVKDPAKGLVDLYSTFQGREIFLCNHLGEEKIGYWHEIDSGFQSRQPISILEERQE